MFTREPFTRESISIADGSTIKFDGRGSLMVATLAGARAEAIALDASAARLMVIDRDGTRLADLIVHRIPTDENLTVSTMNVASALLWSHERRAIAQARATTEAITADRRASDGKFGSGDVADLPPVPRPRHA